MSSFEPTHWNERIPSLEEERWYERLIRLHGITHSWMKALGQPASYRLERASRPELSQTLWLLEKIKLDQLHPQLQELVDGTTVSQFLEELQETVLIVQLTTLENVLENSTDRQGILNQLEQVSWSYSKTLADEAYPNISVQTPHETFQALQSHPYVKPKSLLLETWNDHELSLYWLNSPLTHPSLNRSPFLKELCQLQLESFRGYAYGLNRSLRMTAAQVDLSGRPTFKLNFEK